MPDNNSTLNNDGSRNLDDATDAVTTNDIRLSEGDNLFSLEEPLFENDSDVNDNESTISDHIVDAEDEDEAQENNELDKLISNLKTAQLKLNSKIENYIEVRHDLNRKFTTKDGSQKLNPAFRYWHSKKTDDAKTDDAKTVTPTCEDNSKISDEDINAEKDVIRRIGMRATMLVETIEHAIREETLTNQKEKIEKQIKDLEQEAKAIKKTSWGKAIGLAAIGVAAAATAAFTFGLSLVAAAVIGGVASAAGGGLYSCTKRANKNKLQNSASKSAIDVAQKARGVIAKGLKNEANAKSEESRGVISQAPDTEAASRISGKTTPSTVSLTEEDPSPRSSFSSNSS